MNSTPPESAVLADMMAQSALHAARTPPDAAGPAFRPVERLTKALSDYARGKARLEELDAERHAVARELVKLEGVVEVLKEMQ